MTLVENHFAKKNRSDEDGKPTPDGDGKPTPDDSRESKPDKTN